MKTIITFSFMLTTLFLSGCEKENTTSENTGSDSGQDNNSSQWLIPRDQVRDGGPGKDGIPAIQNPEFIDANQATYLSDDDLVLGFVDESDARAYPHPILDWHEIINDDIKSHSIAVIYCPLTGTGIGWDRVVHNKLTTFGVSGMLYNSNIIPYDRESDSNWSQLLLKSVQGQLAGTAIRTYNLIETTWETWKKSWRIFHVCTSVSDRMENKPAFAADPGIKLTDPVFQLLGYRHHVNLTERAYGHLS